jgi:antitoxin MazE
MQAQIGKWGNSLAVRIPGAYAKELGLQEGTDLDVALVNGGILLRPRSRKYTLDELVGGVTPENLHGETDWGPPVGGEAW